MTPDHILFLIAASFEALKIIIPIGVLTLLTYKLNQL
jgi:hypothetical protein